MLIALRDYLQKIQPASLGDIALHFEVPESVAKSMIEHWIRKGCVVTVDDELACLNHGCGSCQSSCGGIAKAVTVRYRWVGSQS